MAHWTEMIDAKKHCKSVRYEKGWPCTCNKPVKFIRDGVGYCGIHDPVHQIEMQRKRDASAWSSNKPPDSGSPAM